MLLYNCDQQIIGYTVAFLDLRPRPPGSNPWPSISRHVAKQVTGFPVISVVASVKWGCNDTYFTGAVVVVVLSTWVDRKTEKLRKWRYGGASSFFCGTLFVLAGNFVEGEKDRRVGMLTLGDILCTVCRSESPRGRIERMEKCHRTEAGAQPGVEQHDHTPGQHRCRGEGDWGGIPSPSSDQCHPHRLMGHVD